MIQNLWLIGIGAGSLSHITGEGLQALRDAAVILVPQKGADKSDLSEIRRKLIDESGTQADVVFFDYPVRDPALPYLERVDRWHDAIAERWVEALQGRSDRGPAALLVWGDPALYDSTMRIADRLRPKPSIRIVPGITAIQALTAAHGVPLNTVNGVVAVTTGRRLRDEGWPSGAETVVVMLDGEASFQHLPPEQIEIWWGAYLGMPEQLLARGLLAETREEIVSTRAAARARHGWIMDTYLLRRV